MIRATLKAGPGASIGWRLLPLLACAPLSGLHAASESTPPRMYEVTAETVMPHLEENLRHAVTRQERCLKSHDLATAFPILSHESLKGCKLDNEARRGKAVSYLLTCTGGSETTGAAHWKLGATRWQGTLEVKLGGKNMTFYQRVTAKPLGICAQ
ncbi:MAG: DUF3617 family protein [Gammaproteobacteria bacterium]|nr:DUF3617 family protein [Gammaproteobacteria bacterium]